MGFLPRQSGALRAKIAKSRRRVCWLKRAMEGLCYDFYLFQKKQTLLCIDEAFLSRRLLRSRRRGFLAAVLLSAI
jgi:hypothetical protein